MVGLQCGHGDLAVENCSLISAGKEDSVVFREIDAVPLSGQRRGLREFLFRDRPMLSVVRHPSRIAP
jgi:hypothetical protein